VQFGTYHDIEEQVHKHSQAYNTETQSHVMANKRDTMTQLSGYIY